MATYTPKASTHPTLTAATVDTVTITATDFPFIAVHNRASSGAGITFTVDNSTPVALANETYLVLPGAERVVPFKGLDSVKLLSATADAYSVYGVEG